MPGIQRRHHHHQRAQRQGQVQPILRVIKAQRRLHPLQVDDRFLVDCQSASARRCRGTTTIAEPHRNADDRSHLLFRLLKVTGRGGGSLAGVSTRSSFRARHPAVATTTSSVPNGKVKTAYPAGIKASGGCTPYKWAIASGALPTGISTKVSSTTTSLNLVGTPTAAATYSFVAKVTGCGGASRRCRTRSSFRAPHPVSQSPPAVCPTARSKRPILPVIKASGGCTPYKWAIASGALPAGVSAKVSSTYDVADPRRNADHRSHLLFRREGHRMRRRCVAGVVQGRHPSRGEPCRGPELEGFHVGRHRRLQRLSQSRRGDMEEDKREPDCINALQRFHRSQ